MRFRAIILRYLDYSSWNRYLILIQKTFNLKALGSTFILSLSINLINFNNKDNILIFRIRLLKVGFRKMQYFSGKGGFLGYSGPEKLFGGIRFVIRPLIWALQAPKRVKLQSIIKREVDPSN